MQKDTLDKSFLKLMNILVDFQSKDQKGVI